MNTDIQYLTDISQIQTGLQWPLPADLVRLNTYEKNKKLFEGKHEQVLNLFELIYKDTENLNETQLALTFNFQKRLTTALTDLLLGEEVKIYASDANSKEQQIINDVAGTTLFNSLYKACIDLSRFGTGILKLRYSAGKPKLSVVNPSNYFCVVDPLDNTEVTAHIVTYTLPATIDVGTFITKHKQNVDLLLMEIHEAGKITTRCFEYTGSVLGIEHDPTEFFKNIKLLENTGIDTPFVFPINNLQTSDSIYGKDDYQDIDSILQEIEVRSSQIAMILSKYSQPNILGPDSLLEPDATGNYTLKVGGRYFPVQPGEQKPEYMTWDAALDAQFKELEYLQKQLYLISETTPALFGEIYAGVQSGVSLERLMVTPLKKVNRWKNSFSAGIKKIFNAILNFEKLYDSSINIENVNVDWNTGLQANKTEETTNIINRYNAGLISLESSLQVLDGLEGETLKQEIDKINSK